MRGNQLVLGILAHVDSGKTTLSEALLYTGGSLRKPGRVDHGDAFLDNFALERERGITIFSKQALISGDGPDITLLDTPGHVDFGPETERTLQVLDYCLFVISGPDGVQSHTLTLWRLLRQYSIPTFVFVNKMDRPDTDRERILAQLRAKLDQGCVLFGAEEGPQFWEELSMCDEKLLDEYLESGTLQDKSVAAAVQQRKIFPCYFGSALKLQGVEELLKGIRRFAVIPEYPRQFGARVYKISRDSNGNRLTHLKVTGGILRVKMPVNNAAGAGSPDLFWEEKADQLRIYDGARYSTAMQVEAGGICAVAGLSKTYAGQGLGAEQDGRLPFLTPVLTYRLILPEGADAMKVFGQLRQLEEEEPQLHIVWKEALREIHVQVMGEVQIEVLKHLICERFGIEVEFGDGHIVYRETITSPVEGIGHFEPLRHYAEVHLLLEPGEPGSGLQYDTVCSEDVLDRNWQRLILTHLAERAHPGVLTGSPITDMKITLLTGRAHLKHTEGGDFRQAVYRALRQGLMQSKSVLLEPVFSFTLEVPTEQLGRAMSDIQRMHGSFEGPVSEGENSILTGSAPVSEFASYQKEVAAYTGGRGRLSCTLKGYEPCHDSEAVIERIGYDPKADTDNPSSSVFCSHGAGILVEWDHVREHAHVDCVLKPEKEKERKATVSHRSEGGRSGYITEEEIEAIFQSTYKKSVRDYEPYRYHNRSEGVTVAAPEKEKKDRTPSSGGIQEKQEEYLLVDGYNIIFAWEELRSLAKVNIDSARDRLMDICCNYQGYAGCTLILVFDAYKVKGNPGSVQQYHNIYVVYTREAETADQYIEKTVHKIGRRARVTVATSDALEQMIIWGGGALRMSAAGFLEAVTEAGERLREMCGPSGSVSNRLPVPENARPEQQNVRPAQQDTRPEQ